MCCAPCAAPTYDRLTLQGYEVMLYFSNSNIFPKEEYEKRFKYGKKLAKIWDVIIEEDSYEHNIWRNKIKGFEQEPEGGKRCPVCFEHSLERTNRLAEQLDIPYFTTTLTLSPHKVSKVIFEIGKKFPRYLPIDFKKENGFIRSLELSKEYDLYRQNYCGCEFSMRERKKHT